MERVTQNALILAHLKQGVNLSPMEAATFYGCCRLASRIHELRKQGHNITKEMVKHDGKTYAVYSISGNSLENTNTQKEQSKQ